MTQTAVIPPALVPERIALAGGTWLRPVRRDDLEQMVTVVNDNLDRLRPWMPWASAPVSVESQREWLDATLAAAAAGSEAVFAVVDEEDRQVGACGLHTRQGPDVLEIGYWLDAAYEGRGVITAAARALVTLAARIDGVERVEIRCDVANTRSAAVPQRLGFTLRETIDVPLAAASETGRHQVWSIDTAAVRRRGGRAELMG